jgi:apolipoprotein N-acyltransferase
VTAARVFAALLLGAVTVFGFAPFAFAAVPIVTLMLLFALWQTADDPREAARLGFAFGMGLFGAGVSWVYVALNTFGGMPSVFAGIGTALFCAYLALFPGLAGWLATRFTAPSSWPRALAAAAAWTLADWLRGWLFSGFNWLAVGYAQMGGEIGVGPGPFAGYAPIGGLWLVTLAIAACAAALALALDRIAAADGRRALWLILGGVGIAGGGALLARAEWTTTIGEPLALSLVQGNVTQELKFDPEFLPRTYELYSELVDATRGRLIVLPESAFPAFDDEIPESVLRHIAEVASARNGDALVGLFTVDPPLAEGGLPRYHNTVISLGANPPQRYRKRHLVPFGETIPLDWIVGPVLQLVLSIPLASQARGDDDQPALIVAGQRIAVDICYEDAFGADIRPQAASATMLVNVTNDAWYGHSIGALQHNQIAAMRALETGRPMLRATNTGITSAIGHDGRELARLPWFTRGILELQIAGRLGLTPYVRWGDAPAVLLAALMLVLALAAARRLVRTTRAAD